MESTELGILSDHTTTNARTLVCECPDGYATDNNGGCVPPQTIVSGCEVDDECSDPTACVNAICRDPCACGTNAKCDIVNHRPFCTCLPGKFEWFF